MRSLDRLWLGKHRGSWVAAMHLGWRFACRPLREGRHAIAAPESTAIDTRSKARAGDPTVGPCEQRPEAAVVEHAVSRRHSDSVVAPEADATEAVAALEVANSAFGADAVAREPAVVCVWTRRRRSSRPCPTSISNPKPTGSPGYRVRGARAQGATQLHLG